MPFSLSNDQLSQIPGSIVDTAKDTLTDLSANVLGSKPDGSSKSPNMGYHKYQTQHVLRDYFK
jgi:hypothetical protein